MLRTELWSFPVPVTIYSPFLHVWQQQQAAALRQSLKHVNKQPIGHKALHCPAVVFCGLGILAEDLAYNSFDL